jgi:hypothetical protein
MADSPPPYEDTTPSPLDFKSNKFDGFPTVEWLGPYTDFRVGDGLFPDPSIPDRLGRLLNREKGETLSNGMFVHYFRYMIIRSRYKALYHTIDSMMSLDPLAIIRIGPGRHVFCYLLVCVGQTSVDRFHVRAFECDTTIGEQVLRNGQIFPPTTRYSTCVKRVVSSFYMTAALTGFSYALKVEKAELFDGVKEYWSIKSYREIGA